jgi:GNAT superfamily N-acetyltransferase
VAEHASVVRIEPATIDDLVAVADEPREFWGERDLPALHHPLLIHEFGDTAFVIRDEHGHVIAYLFGLLAPAHVGYIHLVAVREGHRRAGLARALYARFAEAAQDLGARSLKAFTQPVNTTSIAFHRSIGFRVSEVPDYAGPGELRVVFTRELSCD